MSSLGNAIHAFFERLQVWVRGRSTLAASAPTELSTDSKDPIAIQFCHDVNKASRLLDFLIEEGHPYHVPDEIIEKVEAARGRVSQANPPTPEQRAELLKAYRDLVAIPGTAVLFDFPATPFWHSRWREAFILISLVLPAIFLLLTLILQRSTQYWYLAVLFSIGSTLLIWGLYTFTGHVTNRKLNQIIVFCYLFTFLVLMGSVAPWWSPELFSEQKQNNRDRGQIDWPPVHILRACVGPSSPDDVPVGVKCNNKDETSAKVGDSEYQWVLNIGGVIQDPKKTGDKPTPQADTATPKPDEKKGDKPTSQAETAAPRPDENKGETLPPVYWIRGGLVVPLYVIILSLIGGAVSMTRRVPEYQRRAMSSQDPLTNQEARENLVFQIMQVFSAPLIAITAYYIVNPSSPLVSVVLGFGSGFASEPILLMIRGLVEKLSPGGSPPPASIAVRVDPPTKTLEPGKSHQFTAHVSGASTSEVTWLVVPSDAGSISQSGYYTAPAEEGKTITVTACSVADRTKCGNASVTIKREQPAKPAAPNTQLPP
jgi:Bacterial Ig-like domain (group 2)